jgi:hypothetical protein
MTDLIEKVKCSVIITLSDGTEIDVSLVNAGNTANITNYITEIDINESTNTQNNNPVGVVSSNTLKLVLNSNDRSLFPENKNSQYYGLMNNTATVKVTLEDVDGIVEFNRYFVSKWISNITSQKPNKVIIECTDLLSIIGKNSVPSGVITQNLSTKEAFIYMLAKLNEQVEDKYKVKYNIDSIIFNEFDKIEYDNLEAGNMSDWLNELSQSTLTNIYIDREDNIKTDYCLDDTAKESVATLSDKVNITNASVDTGGLVNYTGVKTNYITNTINNMSQLTSLSNQVVEPGINIFDNISLGSKVFRLNAVRLKGDKETALKLTKLEYNKRLCNLEVENTTSEDMNCNIEIYGQSFKETTSSIVRSKHSSNEILEITNRLLLPEYANKYTEALLSLIGMRNSSISVTGFFNPRLKLGDTVYVDVDKSINTSGYFKIIGLQWKIGSTLKCTAKLIKTIVEGA